MREGSPTCPEPNCGKPLEPIEEEGDIGIGVQRFTSGFECPEHGPICGICNGCGQPTALPGFKHYNWCFEMVRLREDLEERTVYVLTLTMHGGQDSKEAHYGRVRWIDADGEGCTIDSETDSGSIRHETREGAVEGARRWYSKHGKSKSALVVGTWSHVGFEGGEDFEVLEKKP